MRPSQWLARFAVVHDTATKGATTMLAEHERDTSQFLTVDEFADELKISVRSVFSLIKDGEVHATRLGKKIVRIPRTELERLAGVKS